MRGPRERRHLIGGSAVEVRETAAGGNARAGGDGARGLGQADRVAAAEAETASEPLCHGAQATGLLRELGAAHGGHIPAEKDLRLAELTAEVDGTARNWGS